MLGIGSALVGCSLVICVDCDEGAMAIARENFVLMGIDNSLVDGDDEEEDDEDEEEDSCGDGDGSCRVEYILGMVRHKPTVLERRNGDSGRGGRGSKGNKGRGGRGRGGRRGKVTRTQRHIAQTTSQQGEHPSNDDTTVEASSPSYKDDNDGVPLSSNCVDTVLTNPPFGTKNNGGIDIAFLRAATRLARRAVYSFHKSSTREFLVKTVEGWGYEVEVVAQMKFDIGNIYKFHKKDSVDVEVDLIRVILI